MKKLESSKTKGTKEINDRFLENHKNVAQLSDEQFKNVLDNVTPKMGPALENLAKGPDEDITF